MTELTVHYLYDSTKRATNTKALRYSSLSCFESTRGDSGRGRDHEYSAGIEMENGGGLVGA